MNISLTSTDYYARDKQYNIDGNEQYISNLKKLGYFEFNRNEKINKFIGQELAKMITDEYSIYTSNSQVFDFATFESSSIGSFILKIKFSDKYKSYIQYLNRIEPRAKLLSECGYNKFYELCTSDELEYLGW